MREFFLWLFETREDPFDITLFSAWHFLYIAIIIGAILGTAFYLKDKSEEKKKKVLDFVAYAVIIVYVADFFIQPLFRDGEMNVDKLPFHICTLLSIVIGFTQFNKKFEKIKEPVAFLSIIGPLMYITYPGSALGTESPFCYEIIQTFVYHGLVLAYGVLMLTTGAVIPKLKNCYKSLIGLCMVAIWAAFGNIVYSEGGWGDGYDWFFITGSTFPFVPTPLMPFAVIFCTFAMVMIIYGIYFGVKKIIDKKSLKTA